MSQQQPGINQPEQKTVNHAFVRGRVIGKPRRYTTRDGLRFIATQLRLPAVDEFSSAPTIEVHSQEPIGSDGDSWSGRVRLGGSSRSFKYTDKVSGEVLQGVDVSVRLEVVA